MYELRSNWHGVFKKALAILKANKHPIAQTTVAVIEGKEVQVLPYSQMRIADYNAGQKHKNKKKTFEFPLSPKDIKKITEDFIGFFRGKRIYISPIDDPLKFASVLVHEVNHYINDKEGNYETDEQKFLEELRAEMAEALVFKPHFTRKNLKDLRETVAANYDLPMPATPNKLPPGIFTRPKR